MTALRRIGLLLASALLVPSALAKSPDEISDTFQRGVEALRRGDEEAALAAFQRVVAMDPSHDSAYDLWQTTEHEVWLEMLVKGGQFELIAKRLSGLARAGRAERQDDADAIRAKVDRALGDDVVERIRAVHELSAEHGEFAVPYLVPYLADQDDDDRRVLAMQALSKMSTVVVPPLLEALDAEDAYLRRNVALVLGYVGDSRAGGVLAALATSDPEAGVRSAANESAQKCGSNGEPLSSFLQLGDDYHNRRSNVLSAIDYSSVVWNWADGRLASRAVPRFLYNDEMARKSYYRALLASPDSREARAGIARSYVDAIAKVATYAAAGADVADWEGSVAYGALALGAAGIDALDLALQWAVESNDATTGGPLAEILGNNAREVTPGLRAALQSRDGAMRSEAAVACGTIAHRTGGTAGSDVVRALGEAAGREIVRLAFVIDGDGARGSGFVTALEGEGFFATHWNGGAKGIAMLRRSAGVDAVLIAEALPDLTAAQVVSEVRSDPRLAQTPVFVISDDPEAAVDSWADSVDGVLADVGSIAEVTAALDEGLDGDRARADDLARRASQTLAYLALSGNTDVSSALQALTIAFAHRSDEVALPAMEAVGAAGTPTQIPELVAVVADTARSEASRVAAADALVDVFGRHGVQIGVEGVARLEEVATSDSSLGVRIAALRALGVAEIDPHERAELLRRVREAVVAAASE